MSKRACHLVLAFALLGVLTGGAAARTAALELRTTGLVARVDDHHNLVIVNDGHMLRATPAPSSWLGGRPATVNSPRAGAMTVVRSAEPVDIDRDGDVKIETPSGALHVRASPDATRTLKEGDTALVDVIIVPLRQRWADAL